jgi:hypothetical protein
MKTWFAPFAVAVVLVALVPDAGEAQIFRRRCRPVVCPCPPVVCPPVVYPPCPPQVLVTPPAESVVVRGRRYWLQETADQGEFREEAATPPALRASLPDPDNVFDGEHRKLPKTTIVDTAVIEEFGSVAALVDNILERADDEQMKNTSGITRTTATRHDAEKRNVRVTGFIYAYVKEDDNDYHVILGDAPGTVPLVFLNVEVSGIPVGGTAANRQRLTAARDEFKAAFGLGEKGPTKYKKFLNETGANSPVPVRITGSLFWDVDHGPGTVGPKEFRPQTSWEIHPVSEIVFLGP